jgi:glycosyltransferase 2 family protein
MWKTLLRVLISVAFLAAFYFTIRDNLSSIFEKLANIDKPLAAAAVGIFFLTVLVLARRMQLIFEAVGLRLKMAQCTYLTFIGYFFNNFLPTAVGGDLVKALCAARLTNQPMKCLSAVLMDRVFGLFTFILIPSVSLLFAMHAVGNERVPVLVYSFLAASLVLVFLAFNSAVGKRLEFIGRLLDGFHLGRKIRALYNDFYGFKHQKKIAAQAVGLSILGQIASIFTLYFLAVALGAKPSLAYFFLLVPVISLVSMVPSLGGLGVREKAYTVFLGPYIGQEHAAALSILWLGLLILSSLIGGLIYLFKQDYHVRLGGVPKGEASA